MYFHPDRGNDGMQQPNKIRSSERRKIYTRLRVEAVIQQLERLTGEAHRSGWSEGCGKWLTVVEADGSEDDFERFCITSFVADPDQLEQLYSTLGETSK